MGSGTSVRPPELAACAQRGGARGGRPRRSSASWRGRSGGAVRGRVRSTYTWPSAARVHRQQHVSDVLPGCRRDRCARRAPEAWLAAPRYAARSRSWTAEVQQHAAVGRPRGTDAQEIDCRRRAPASTSRASARTTGLNRSEWPTNRRAAPRAAAAIASASLARAQSGFSTRTWRPAASARATVAAWACVGGGDDDDVGARDGLGFAAQRGYAVRRQSGCARVVGSHELETIAQLGEHAYVTPAHRSQAHHGRRVSSAVSLRTRVPKCQLGRVRRKTNGPRVASPLRAAIALSLGGEFHQHRAAVARANRRQRVARRTREAMPMKWQRVGGAVGLVLLLGACEVEMGPPPRPPPRPLLLLLRRCAPARRGHLSSCRPRRLHLRRRPRCSDRSGWPCCRLPAPAPALSDAHRASACRSTTSGPSFSTSRAFRRWC